MHERFATNLRDPPGRARLRALRGCLGIGFSRTIILAGLNPMNCVEPGLMRWREVCQNMKRWNARRQRISASDRRSIFGGGCIVNFANFSTLPQCGGLVVHDELVHARVHEGLRRRRAELAEVSQNDVVAFDAAIGNWNEIRSCCDP